jgi:pentatricopeptide repeat protein
MALHVNETGSAPAATLLNPSKSASQVPFNLNFLSTDKLLQAAPAIFFLQSASPQFNLVHEWFTYSTSRFGVVPNVFTCQFFIKGICKKHKVEGAVTMLDEMPTMGMIPNLVTYTTILVIELFFFVKLWTSFLSTLGVSIKPSPGPRTPFFRPASSLPLTLHLAGVFVRICLHRMRRTTDCVYFLVSLLACKTGIACEYRHSAVARPNSRDCWYCLNPTCLFRHPPLVGPAGHTTKNASKPMAGTPLPRTDEMARNTLARTLSHETDVKPGMHFGNPTFVSVGSCCLVGILCAGQLYIANAGDSQLVLGRQEKVVNVANAVQLSSEQNASVEFMREALHSLHPNDPQIVVFKHKVWRVQGLIHASLGNAHIESAERWDSFPGYDVLMEDKSVNLRYEDDPEYLLDFDREHRELNSRFLGFDFEASVAYDHMSLMQNFFFVVLVVFNYVSNRKWRGISRQRSFKPELLAGPQKFRYNEMTPATFHDGRQWVPTWPWLQIRFAWVRISEASGRFKDKRIELGSWPLWRSTWQKLMHAQWIPKTLYMVAMDPGRFMVLGSVRTAGFSLHIPTKLNGLAYGCCLEPRRFLTRAYYLLWVAYFVCCV